MKTKYDLRSFRDSAFQRIVSWILLIAITVLPFGGLTRDMVMNLGDMLCAKSGGAIPIQARGIRMASFRTRVGGVGFAAVAQPEDPADSIEGIRYVSSLADGERLQVKYLTVGQDAQWVTVPAYDWELIPCAKFAQTDDESCFTLFGEFEDEAKTQEFREQGYRILSYHPEFEDTLMGLRLFQADILLLSESACDLPKVNGAYLLGAGELEPLVSDNLITFAEVKEWQSDLMTQYESYVITDQDEVYFDLFDDGGESFVSLLGTPYWDCWLTNPAHRSALELARDDVFGLKFMQFNLERIQAGESVEIPQEQLFELFGEFLEGQDVNGEIEVLASERVPEEDQTISLDYLSDELSARIEASNNGINPTVYSAVKTGLELTALFRYVKRQNPADYTTFIASLAEVAVLPAVDTPDHIRIPEEQASSESMLQDLLRDAEELERTDSELNQEGDSSE